MKNKLSTKITAALLITSTLSSVVFTTHANAQAATSGTGANGPLLANAVAGKLLLKADVGYVYSFAGDWNKSNSSSPSIGGNTSTATGGVGYGVSLGWTSKTGFGLSADYLGFNHKWTGLGTSDATTQFNYDAPYHVMTITPSYRFRLDSADNWGLRIGLGVGFSLSDVSWAKNLSASGAQSGGLRVAGGAVYSIQSNSNDPYVNATSGATGDIHTCYHHLGNNRALGGIIADSNVETDNSGYTPLANKCYYTSDANLGRSTQVGGTDTIDDTAIANWLIALGVTSDGSSLFYNGQIIATNSTTIISGGDIQIDTQSATYANGVAAGVLSVVKAATDAAKAAASSGGSAKDDAGFVLAPQVALEYDNNLLHADINVKYIHGLLDVRYFGSEGSVSGTATSGAITYTSKAGPLALFIGAGLGINF